jgi:hypothetical protein
LIALFVLGKKGHMVAVAAAGFLFLVEPGIRGHIDFASNDGLDFGILAGFIKINGPEKVAMVGQRACGHAICRRFFGDIMDRRRCVQD